MKSLPFLRTSVLATALVLAIPLAHAVDDLPMTAPKISVASETNQTYDRFIVTYRDNSAERSDRSAVLQNVRAAVSRSGLDRATVSSNGAAISPLSVSYQRKLAVGADLVRTSRKLSQSEANNLMQQIAADPAVAHVQPDYRRQIVRDIKAPLDVSEQVKTQISATPQTFTPNDPDYAQYQWHFWDPIGGANINNAWDLADGTDITVAVLDTGITRHSDIDTSLADAGYDFISDAFISGRDTDGRAAGGWDLGDWTNTAPWNDPSAGCLAAGDPGQSSSWHGTHVSGTVAELTNNTKGMAGVAHNAKVLPVRVLGHCGGHDSDIADAIEWASGGHVDGVPDNTHVAQVINMSLGGPGTCSASDVTGKAIADAISRGTTVVVSAGNSATDAANFSPASCPGAVTVASNGITGKRAFYSNYGSTVTLAAPGGGVYANDASSGTTVNTGFVFSALNAGKTSPGAEDYAGYAGTSQAAPHVSGTVAMILGATKAAGMATPSPAEIKDALVKSARPFPVLLDHPIGAGIVDAYAAVNRALGNDDGGGDETATPLAKGVILSAQSGNPGTSALYAIDVPAGATVLNIRTIGGTGDVSLYVKVGSAPAADGSDASYKSTRPGNNEAVVIATPQAAVYYLRLSAGQTAFANVSVLADYKQ